MSKKGKKDFLILSISVLFLLVLIFKFTGGISEKIDPESKSAARYLIEGVHKTSEFISIQSKKISEEYRARKAEREAKREAEREAARIEEEALTYSELVETINNSVNVVEAQEDDAVPFEESKEGETYLFSESIAIPEGLDIPTVVDEVEFRPDNTMVYAAAYAKYYKDPNFEEGAVGTAGKWEAFLRVGISKDCCYQLITNSGKLVYADGTHFRRNRENMETTEEISFESEPVLLDVKYISQFPSLPNGCEITSLATVLNYYGFDVSKDTLSREYLPKKGEGKANFYFEFVGDPSSRNSFGCYADAIVTAADNYLFSKDTTLCAHNLTGSSFSDLLLKVKNNIPVIVWTAAFLETDPGYSNEWIVDGEYLIWKTNLHCEVIIGYNLENNIVIVSDPMRGIQEYDMDLFIKRYKQFYSQAVTIE